MEFGIKKAATMECQDGHVHSTVRAALRHLSALSAGAAAGPQECLAYIARLERSLNIHRPRSIT